MLLVSLYHTAPNWWSIRLAYFVVTVTSLHYLTLTVVSLQQEAEPVGHAVVSGKLTS